MTKLAKDITIDHAGGPGSFTIDGEPFPWYVSADGVEVSIGEPGLEMSRITLTIPFEGNFREWAK